jgi:hypothetical protein
MIDHDNDFFTQLPPAALKQASKHLKANSRDTTLQQKGKFCPILFFKIYPFLAS